MTRRRTLAACLAAATTLLLAACGGAGNASEGDGTDGAAADHGQFDFSANWLKNSQYGGEYLADDRGYYTEAGFDSVNIIPGGPGGTSPMVMVVSDQALMGTSNTLAVADSISNSETPIKIVAATLQSTPFTVISLGDDPIRTPQDLIGKRIGNKTGANEAVWDAFLKVNGISPDQLTVVTVQTDPQPLINGDIDGLVGFSNNEAVILKLGGHDVVEMPMSENGLNFATDTLIVSQDAIDNDREKVKAALYATIRGWHDAIAEPEEAARLAVEEYGTDLGLDLSKEVEQMKAINKLVTGGETAENGIFTLTDEQIAENMAAVEAMGYTISEDELFDMSLLDEVYAEHPELKEMG